MVLRMSDRVSPRDRWIDIRRTSMAEFIPDLCTHRQVEVGKYHRPLRKPRDPPQQGRHTLRSAGYTRRDHRRLRRTGTPAPCRVPEQAVAAVGRIELAPRLQLL